MSRKRRFKSSSSESVAAIRKGAISAFIDLPVSGTCQINSRVSRRATQSGSCVRYDNGTSLDLAVVEQLVSLVRTLQWKVFNQHLDFSSPGETNHFQELGDCAPKGARDGTLLRRAEEVNRQSSATETDNRQVAEHASHLSCHRERRVHTHQVKHHFGALSMRHVLDTRDGLIVREHYLVGPHLLGDLQFVDRGVHGGDGRRGA